jgi:hypothetical protein
MPRLLTAEVGGAAGVGGTVTVLTSSTVGAVCGEN